MGRRLARLVGVFFLLAAVGGLYAQTGAGNVQGTAKDATGAVVPGAKVTLTNTATGVVQASTTTDAGFFLFPSVQLGPYDLSVEAPGMDTWKGQLNLLAGQSVVLTVNLKVGATATEVTVAGDVTPLLTTNSAVLATVVERQRIEQLPLDGRIVTNVILMTTPGLEPGSVPRVYGLRYASEMVQDGAVLENRDWGSLPARPPGLDTISEFRVETSNSSAKMNRPGTMVLSTRSGTNQVHGSAFETARNNGFGIARSRTDYYDKAPHLVRNEFGVSLGGPVYIPKVYNGRNKTFFFFAYEAYRFRSNYTFSGTEPTMAMRQGDFSGLIDAQNRLYVLYDPNTTTASWSRTPFPGNKIPVSRESPLTKYLYSVTPAPTTPDNPLVRNNYFGPAPSNTSQYTVTTRIDHRLSDKDQIFGRFSHGPSSVLGLGYGGAWTLDKQANAYVDEGRNDSAVGSWIHSFSPTFFSETLVTVSRDYRGQIPYTGMKEIATSLGLPNPFGGIGFPRLTSTGFTQMYDASINYTVNYAWITNFDENLTKVKGRHEFQFGGRFRYERLDTLADQQEQAGTHNFATLATSLYDPTTGGAYGPTPFTGFDAANMFLGVASYASRFNRGWYRLRAGERSLYFQDNFRVNSRLTLNFGLRYERNSPGTEANNSFIGFDKANKAVVLNRSIDDLAKLGVLVPSIAQTYQNLGMKIETSKQGGLPDNLVYANNLDFGPRAGFAYNAGSVTRPLVIRGGYAIYSYPESLRLFNGLGEFAVPSSGYFSQNQNDAARSPDGLPNYLLRSVPTIIAGVNSANVLPLDKPEGIVPGTGEMYYLDPHQPTARAHEWNLTIEREIWPKTSIKASYVGTHGARMSQWVSYNDNPPDYVWYKTTGLPLPTGRFADVIRRPYDQQVFGAILDHTKLGWSNDSSFQVEIQHRYSKGYAFQMFYVMSNAMRTAGNGWRDDTLPETNQFLPGVVPEDLNARNRLLNYRRDTGIPKHRVNWNWLVDLPVGNGKLIGRQAKGLLNALVGGWQLAGSGSLVSRYFQLPTSNWGPITNLEVYGKKYPIQDCRSGTCYSGWLYWNGYIPANLINSHDEAGNPNGVMGVPASYKPMQTPLIPTPKDGGNPNDPLYPYYESNNIWVPLKDGTQQITNIGSTSWLWNAGGILHPLQNQYVPGPWSWGLDASLFKAVRIKEHFMLRFNADFFNVLNRPGTGLPGSDGVVTTQYSDLSPRTMQLTLRLSW